jgi:hypothetical protein
MLPFFTDDVAEAVAPESFTASFTQVVVTTFEEIVPVSSTTEILRRSPSSPGSQRFERGLSGLLRCFDEWKLVVAGNSALSTLCTFATCATTSNCASKVAYWLVLVLVGAGQDVLAMHHGNFGEHSPERLDGE